MKQRHQICIGKEEKKKRFWTLKTWKKWDNLTILVIEVERDLLHKKNKNGTVFSTALLLGQSRWWNHEKPKKKIIFFKKKIIGKRKVTGDWLSVGSEFNPCWLCITRIHIFSHRLYPVLWVNFQIYLFLVLPWILNKKFYFLKFCRVQCERGMGWDNLESRTQPQSHGQKKGKWCYQAKRNGYTWKVEP